MFCGLLLYLFQNRITLNSQNVLHLKIFDSRYHCALHNGAALVILDITNPFSFIQRNLCCKSLFSEIANSVIVGISQKVLDICMARYVVLQMVHNERTITLDLLCRCHSAKYNFCKLLFIKRSITNAAYHLVWITNQCYTAMVSVLVINNQLAPNSASFTCRILIEQYTLLAFWAIAFERCFLALSVISCFVVRHHSIRLGF